MKSYIAIYHRPLDGIEVECVGIGLRVSAIGDALAARNVLEGPGSDIPAQSSLFDLQTDSYVDVPTIARTDLQAGQTFPGPGLIKDYGTTICVPHNYTAVRHDSGHLILTHQTSEGKG